MCQVLRVWPVAFTERVQKRVLLLPPYPLVLSSPLVTVTSQSKLTYVLNTGRSRSCPCHEAGTLLLYLYSWVRSHKHGRGTRITSAKIQLLAKSTRYLLLLFTSCKVRISDSARTGSLSPEHRGNSVPGAPRSPPAWTRLQLRDCRAATASSIKHVPTLAGRFSELALAGDDYYNVSCRFWMYANTKYRQQFKIVT